MTNNEQEKRKAVSLGLMIAGSLIVVLTYYHALNTGYSIFTGFSGPWYEIWVPGTLGFGVWTYGFLR